jgi:uncharacterized protein (TIGR02266 family)
MGGGQNSDSELERRRSRRLPIRVRVTYAETEEFLLDHEANISGYGMYIRTESPLDVGVEFRLCFEVAGFERPIETVAEVRWSNPPGDPFVLPGMGVLFGALSPRDRKEIDRLMLQG